MRRARVSGLVLCATAGVLISGCSSASSGHAQASGSAAGAHSSVASAPTTPKDQLLLQQSDFPAGAQKQPVSAQMIQAQTGRMTKLFSSTRVTPTQCGPRQVDLEKKIAALLSDSAVAGYSAGSAMFTEQVAGQTVDLDGIKSAVSGECTHVSVEQTVEGQQAHTTAAITPVPLAGGLDPAHAYAYETTLSTQVGPRTVHSASLSGYAKVRGMTVSLTEVGFGESRLDQAQFGKLFASAVAKVRNAE